MDDIEKSLLRLQSIKEQTFQLVKRNIEAIDRISEGGFNNSEDDKDIVIALANIVIGEYNDHKLSILLQGTKYVL